MYLSFLCPAALLVGVVTILVARFAPQCSFAPVLLAVLEVGGFVVFGRPLVNRLVLWPLDRVWRRRTRSPPATCRSA